MMMKFKISNVTLKDAVITPLGPLLVHAQPRAVLVYNKEPLMIVTASQFKSTEQVAQMLFSFLTGPNGRPAQFHVELG